MALNDLTIGDECYVIIDGVPAKSNVVGVLETTNEHRVWVETDDLVRKTDLFIPNDALTEFAWFDGQHGISTNKISLQNAVEAYATSLSEEIGALA